MKDFWEIVCPYCNSDDIIWGGINLAHCLNCGHMWKVERQGNIFINKEDLECKFCSEPITKKQYKEFNGCCSLKCMLNQSEFESLTSAGR